MKHLIISIILCCVFAGYTTAQKVEVLYFKANLPCCHAKACTNLEGQVKEVVEKNFTKKDVIFKTVLLAESENAELVSKYNAKSQTVIVVSKNKKKEQFEDVSDIVRNFNRTKEQSEFEQKITASIKKML
jgi:hypothetical protein